MTLNCYFSFKMTAMRLNNLIKPSATLALQGHIYLLNLSVSSFKIFFDVNVFSQWKRADFKNIVKLGYNEPAEFVCYNRVLLKPGWLMK
jgi:hypothetical protein